MVVLLLTTDETGTDHKADSFSFMESDIQIKIFYFIYFILYDVCEKQFKENFLKGTSVSATVRKLALNNRN